jgi:hypothetical protein
MTRINGFPFALLWAADFWVCRPFPVSSTDERSKELAAVPRRPMAPGWAAITAGLDQGPGQINQALA